MDGGVLSRAGEDAHGDEVASLSPGLERGGKPYKRCGQSAGDITTTTRSEASREGEVGRDAGSLCQLA